MVGFSRDYRRSSSSFLVSFFVHIGLIIACSLFLIDYGGRGQITLHFESADDSFEMVSFDSPEDLYDSNETELFESQPVELTPVDQLESLLDSLPQDDSGLVNSPFQLDPPMSADALSLDLPTQGKSRFFGIEASGDRIIYIIDMSVSMSHIGYHARRYDRAVAEVMRSVDQLDPEQTFYVYLFCFKKYEMDIGQPDGAFCLPNNENKRKLRSWLDSVNLGAGTDPRESLAQALDQKPTCVFLLSDGEFNGVRYNNGRFGRKKTAVVIAKQFNSGGCPIHTIGLEDKGNQSKMTSIAKQSGGTYRFVSARDP